MKRKRLLAAVLALSLLGKLAGCAVAAEENSESEMKPEATIEETEGEAGNVYRASAVGKNGDVTVEVTFDGTVIASVTVVEQSETPSIAGAALEQIPAAIIESQSVGVDAVSGATVTSKAILDGVKDCILQAGLSVEDYSAAGAAPQAGEDQAVDCDVVVVGAGNSGLVTAIAAADAGADVVVVEKLGVTGGTTSASSAMYFTVDSEYAETNAPEVDDSMEYALEYVMGIHNLSDLGTLDEERMESVLAQTGEAVDYLTGLGLEGTTTMWTESFGQWPCTQWNDKGSGLVLGLTSIAEQKGAEILLNCPATDLVLDENGEVAGVICDYEGGTLTVNAKKVVLACGGFGQNEDMIAEYVQDWTPMETYNRICVGNTGDGITMALAVGAAVYDDWKLMASAASTVCSLAPDYKAALTGSFDHFSQMSFNGDGLRYTNENPYMPIMAANAMLDDPSDVYYYLFDGSNGDYLADLETGISMGEVVYGETVEELAAALDIDEAVLRMTFDEYQGYCESGVDEAFGKDAEHLKPYDESSGLYAVRYYPMLIGSFGGVVTDNDAHVLNTDGEVIANLFAVGEMSNRCFFNEMYVGGTSLGFGAVMGRAAAAAAVEEINSQD